MIGQGDGRIVNVSSIYAKVGSKGESAYCSAKAGLIGLTKSLAREWGAKGVRVNAVLPGLTETPTIRDVMSPKFKEMMIAETPLGRIADPVGDRLGHRVPGFRRRQLHHRRNAGGRRRMESVGKGQGLGRFFK